MTIRIHSPTLPQAPARNSPNHVQDRLMGPFVKCGTTLKLEPLTLISSPSEGLCGRSDCLEGPNFAAHGQKHATDSEQCYWTFDPAISLLIVNLTN